MMTTARFGVSVAMSSSVSCRPCTNSITMYGCLRQTPKSRIEMQCMWCSRLIALASRSKRDTAAFDSATDWCRNFTATCLPRPTRSAR